MTEEKPTEEPQEEKRKHKYIFPNFLANAMAKVDLRTQYEASMMSMTLIGIGLIITPFYLFFFTTLVLWYKIFLIVNCVAGLVFISSFLVTTYQQYLSYMEIAQFQKDCREGIIEPELVQENGTKSTSEPQNNGSTQDLSRANEENNPEELKGGNNEEENAQIEKKEEGS